MSARPVTEAAWSTDEDQRLAAAAADVAPATYDRWGQIAEKVGGGKTAQDCKVRFNRETV